MAKQKGDVGTSAVSTPVSGPNPMAASTKGSYGQDYNKDGRIGFGERIRDMFDGGGPAVSGGPFRGGGLLSAFGNAVTGNRGMGVGPDAGVGFAGYGYMGPQGWVTAAQDMRNGGGPGMAGPYFQGGGGYSALANLLGIRPAGFEGDRPEMTVGTEKNPAPDLTAVLASTRAPQPAPERGLAGMQLNPDAYTPAQSVSDMANDPYMGMTGLLSPPAMPQPSTRVGPTMQNADPMRRTMDFTSRYGMLSPNPNLTQDTLTYLQMRGY